MPAPAVTVCTLGGSPQSLPAGTEELLTLGRALAATLDTPLGWLVLGSAPSGIAELAGRYGVGVLHRIDDARLTPFAPDVHVEALAQYWKAYAPRALLVGQSFDARLVAPRLAGRVGAGVVMNAVALAVDDGGCLAVTTSAYGGDTRAVYELRANERTVIGVTPNAITATPATSAAVPPVEEVAVDLGGVTERVRVVGRAETTGPRIEDAEIIVAGGRGLGAAENYHLVEDLAQALGGMAAASRPIVDDGWADPSRQVGLTGKITRPTLYIAAGISGASQHMVGCAAAKTLVAINRDPDAAIFRYARYGIVGNCLEVLPELVRAVKG